MIEIPGNKCDISVFQYLMDYTRSNLDVTESELINELANEYLDGNIFYAEEWMEAFKNALCDNLVILNKNFETLKNRLLSLPDNEETTLTLVSIINNYLIDNPIMYLIDLYIDEIQNEIDNIPSEKTEPDQETLDFWNEMNIINSERINLKIKLEELNKLKE